MRMRTKASAVVPGALLVALCLLCLIGCGSTGEGSDGRSGTQEVDVSDISGGVAATVNGEEIGENAISAYIANFRAANALESDDVWGSWLIDYAYTIDSVRGDTLEMLENQLLIRQAAAENGVSVTEDEVDAAVAQARSSYESDDDWAQYLAAQALTEQGFREQTELSLLGDKLAQVVAPDASDDAERQAELSTYMNDYRDAADIHEEFLPDDAPYYIDLAPYEEAARLANPDETGN